METVAVYFEKPIGTYGVKAQEGFSLATLECAAPALASFTGRLAAMEPGVRFISCVAAWEEGLSTLEVCLPSDQLHLLEKAASASGARLRHSRPVAVVSLQGPHFGDRWGIASEALDALTLASVEPEAVLGVTHTLQLIIKPSDAEAALDGLKGRFSSPGAGHE